MKSQKERMLSGELYKADDPELRKDFQHAKKLVREFNATTESESSKRKEILHKLFKKAGQPAYIEPPFHIDYGNNTTIGNHFYANYDCIFIDVCNITIGDNVFLAPRVGLYTAGHPIDASIRGEELEFGSPITIGNDVWIGGNVVVTPGVTIGDNVVIGAGAIVTKDIPSNVVVVGNPARVLRKITDNDREYWQAKKNEYLEDFRNN